MWAVLECNVRFPFQFIGCREVGLFCFLFSGLVIVYVTVWLETHNYLNLVSLQTIYLEPIFANMFTIIIIRKMHEIWFYLQLSLSAPEANSVIHKICVIWSWGKVFWEGMLPLDGNLRNNSFFTEPGPPQGQKTQMWKVRAIKRCSWKLFSKIICLLSTS